MILQEEFEKCGYKDILVGDNDPNYKINLVELFDVEHKPEELIGIYISEQRDDLFFLLNGDKKDIKCLCEDWDNKIRVFSIMNNNSMEFKKLKYNIIQLIVYSENEPDRRIEGNLQISRKIIIKGDLKNEKKIIVDDDDDAIELPFHMILEDEFKPDENKIKRLEQLLPKDEEVYSLMKKTIKKKHARNKIDERAKFLDDDAYKKIMGWLEK